MSQKKKWKVLFVGKKENISANKFKLKGCIDGIIYILAILYRENIDERGDKLHLIPNNLNPNILVFSRTYNGWKWVKFHVHINTRC